MNEEPLLQASPKGTLSPRTWYTREVLKEQKMKRSREGHGKSRLGTQLNIPDDGIFALNFVACFKKSYIKASVLNNKPVPQEEDAPKIKVSSMEENKLPLAINEPIVEQSLVAKKTMGDKLAVAINLRVLQATKEQIKEQPIYVPLDYYETLPAKYSNAVLAIDWSSYRSTFGGISHRNGRLFYSEQQIQLKDDVSVKGVVQFQKGTVLTEPIVQQMIEFRK